MRFVCSESVSKAELVRLPNELCSGAGRCHRILPIPFTNVTNHRAKLAELLFLRHGIEEFIHWTAATAICRKKDRQADEAACLR